MQLKIVSKKPSISPSLETDRLNIKSPQFQQGYQDAYTHQAQRSNHRDYLDGYIYGVKDRVLYRDC